METPELLEDASGLNMVLVDHSEYTQSADGLQDAKIIGIIDHHGDGYVTTANPLIYDASRKKMLEQLKEMTGTGTVIKYGTQEEGADLVSFYVGDRMVKDIIYPLLQCKSQHWQRVFSRSDDLKELY